VEINTLRSSDCFIHPLKAYNTDSAVVYQNGYYQMARELGLNPKKFGSIANTKQEPWKLPLPEYIEELYFKHFKKSRPDNVRSIEQMVRDYRRKKQERKIRRIEEKNTDPCGK
jgi:hypothetical protein